MTITKQKLSTLQKIEPILIDLVAVAVLILPFQIELAESWHPIIFILVLFYALYEVKQPKGIFSPFFFGFGMVGIMFGIAGIAMLITNSLMGALLGLFVAYPMLMLRANPLTKFYEHPIRIVIMPIAFTLFAVAAQDVLTQRMPPSLAFIAAAMLFLPVRYFLNLDRPQKWYHSLLLIASLSFYMYNIYQQVFQSPSAAMWKITEPPNKIDERIYRLSQTDSTAVFRSTTKINIDGYGYKAHFKRLPNGDWVLDEVASKKK